MCLLLREILTPFQQVVTSGILTMNNEPGHHIVKFGIGSENINTVIAALFIILVSWIMSEGQRLNDEQCLTV